MRKIGLTGGIGSGKSTVARYLEVLGFPVFYSDAVAKHLMETDVSVREDLLQLFGTMVLSENGLNRSYIAEKLFQDATVKLKLEALIHPRVRQAFEVWAMSQNTTLVFNEAAILFESGSYKNLDEIWLVVSPSDLRKSRLVVRDSTSKHQIEQRMLNQWTDEQKIPLADFVIYNDEVRSVLLQIETRLQSL